MSGLCLLDCLFKTKQIAELSQLKTMCAFVILRWKMCIARNIGYNSSTVMSSSCQFAGHCPCIQCVSYVAPKAVLMHLNKSVLLWSLL